MNSSKAEIEGLINSMKNSKGNCVTCSDYTFPVKITLCKFVVTIYFENDIRGFIIYLTIFQNIFGVAIAMGRQPVW